MRENISEQVYQKLNEITGLLLGGKLSIFFGSGISVYSPSNLPTGSSLRRAIFEEIFNTIFTVGIRGNILKKKEYRETNEKLLKGYTTVQNSGHKASDSHKHYPFEVFIQTINEYTGIVEYLSELYKLGKPNFIHQFLAQMIIKGYLWRIMTTNFDEHLENAVKSFLPFSIHDAFNQVMLPLHDEGVYSFASSFPLCVLYKIHGTCSDLPSMRTTLDAISSSILSPFRGPAIKQFFEDEHDILILGYSGSDEFDVNRILETCKKDKKIFWIRRPKKGQPTVERLEAPFKGFNGYMIRIELSDLIEYLGAKTGIPIDPVPPKNEIWRSSVKKWGDNLSVGQKVYSVSKLLYDVQMNNEVIHILESAIKEKYLFNEREVAAFQIIKSNILRERGYFDDAESEIQKEISVSEKLQDKRLIAVQKHSLAISLYSKGNYTEAEKLYRESLEVFRELNDQLSVSISLHQLGNIRYFKGEYEEAWDLYRNSLEIRLRLGDQKEVAGSYHALGRIKQDIGDYDGAERLYRMSLDISEKLGNQRGISLTLTNLAMVVQDKGDLDGAEKLFRRSIEISKELGDQQGVSLDLQNLGTIYEIRKNFDEAENLYLKSLEIKKRIGDMRGIGFSYQGLGSIELERGNFDVAERHFKKVLEIREQLMDRKGIGTVYIKLGELNKARQDIEKARLYYEKALIIFRSIGLFNRVVTAEKRLLELPEN